MENLLPYRDSDFEKAFTKIASIQTFRPHIKEIVSAIVEDSFDKKTLDRILSNYNFRDVSDIKEDVLDLLLLYIGIVLDDSVIKEKELANLKILKRIFKIREGDFYTLRHDEIQQILNLQFKKIYQDNFIDHREAILKVGLQELFDLGYDQFQDLSKDEVKAALTKGADLNDLDAVIKLSVLRN